MGEGFFGFFCGVPCLVGGVCLGVGLWFGAFGERLGFGGGGELIFFGVDIYVGFFLCAIEEGGWVLFGGGCGVLAHCVCSCMCVYEVWV